MELLNLRWASDLLNECWRSNRVRAAPDLPTVPMEELPGRTGERGMMHGLELPCSRSLSSAPGNNLGCDSLPVWSLSSSSGLQLGIFLPTLKSFLSFSTSFTQMLSSLLTSIPPWGCRRLDRSQSCSVFVIWAALASWLLCDGDPCMTLSNWTLQFSLFLPLCAEHLHWPCCLRKTSWDSSVCCAFVELVLHFDWVWPIWFRSGASLRIAVISCGWFTAGEAVLWFRVGDVFWSSAAVGLQLLLLTLLPSLFLHPCLALEGTNTGCDLSCCRENN